MIYLHTLGESLIKVGEKEIRPNSPLVFAALLYLGMERGRRVPRTVLQELLFPKSAERSKAHSLRQLLYKLRQLGVPLKSDIGGVLLPATCVEEVGWDMLTDELHVMGADILPQFRVPSDEFGAWLEGLRASIAARQRNLLVADLIRTRNSGDHATAGRVAVALLQLDPLNEEATLARAEALALAGQKHEALRLLEAYSAEVGAISQDLRLAPDVLRRRIADRLDLTERSRTPLVGRQSELTWLLAQFGRAVDALPTITILWGEAGVGKTRLVEEFAAHVALRRVCLESAHCQPHDVDRPLGPLIDLVPKLLEVRGALGVAPASLDILRRLAGDSRGASSTTVSDPRRVSTQIPTALTDLLVSVASEGAIVLIVEDAHWLDDASFRLLLGLIHHERSRLHLVLTSRSKPRFGEGARVSENVFVRQLAPLSTAAATELIARATGYAGPLNYSTVLDCVALAAGNPLFLCTIAEHLRLRGTAPPSRTDIAELLQQRIRVLDSQSLLLIRFVAAFGNHGSLARLAASTGMDQGALLLAFQNLADRGLLVRREASITSSHMLLTQAVLDDTPPALRVAVFERVATVLEEDGVGGKLVGVLWSCADCWRAADNWPASLRVLRRCADFAIDACQPALACSALEKAQEVCDDGQQEGLIEETIRVAELARAHEIVIRNVDRYNEVLRRRAEPLPPFHSVQLKRIRAAYVMGEPVWELRAGLLQLAIDGNAPLESRIVAARAFLGAAIQHLAKPEGEKLKPTVDDLMILSNESGPAREVRLIFHTYFGDLLQARTDAEALFASQTDTNDAWSLWINIANALFYSGAVDAAINAFQVAIRHAARFGLHNLAAIECGELAALHLYIGDTVEARNWHERAESYLRECDPRYAALQITNRIAFALQSGALDVARRGLADLEAYRGSGAPQAIRAIRCFEILLARAHGHLEESSFDLDELTRLDNVGRENAEHHGFALALYVLLRAVGRGAEAELRMRDYLTTYRRERFSLAKFYALMVDDDRELNALIASSEAFRTSLVTDSQVR